MASQRPIPRLLWLTVALTLLAISVARPALGLTVTPAGNLEAGAQLDVGEPALIQAANPDEFPPLADRRKASAEASGATIAPPTTQGASATMGTAPANRGSVAATTAQRAFIEAAGAAAQASQRATGVPASVTVAQAILESDWGRSTIAGANNYFGIKATSGPGPAGVVWANTREFIGGAWTTVQAPFRAYHSMDESFVDHGLFLLKNPRYAPAFQHSDDPATFARLIHQAGYATAPTYADSLISLMDRYALYQFDAS
jgi:flagellum-specific peptidoglycan hydrolase FlgJ